MFLILATCGVLGFVHSAIKIPFKDDVVNDLHDLLVSKTFIDKELSLIGRNSDKTPS